MTVQPPGGPPGQWGAPPSQYGPPATTPAVRGAGRAMLVVLAVFVGLCALAWFVVALTGLLGDPAFSDPLTRDAGRDGQRGLTGLLGLGGALLGTAGLLQLRSGLNIDRFRGSTARVGRRLIGVGALISLAAVIAPYVLSASADGSDLTRPMFVTAVLLTIFTLGQAMIMSAAWLIFGLTLRRVAATG